MMSTTGAGKFRTDIQALRAIAVAAVVAYHIWPTMLPGGYVGVDIFFVISGYLITGLLYRELSSSSKICLSHFYARRIRRLLPAASLTLLAVAIATVAWASTAEWRTVARDLVGSALYVENFILVQRQVDYLALDAAASPVQHFWSLSVEEQFYIFWPILMVCIGYLARKNGWRLERALFFALASLCLSSLTYAIYVSYVDPAPAYFLTTTRIWELGVGGLLALWKSSRGLSTSIRRAVGGAGLLSIAMSAIFYSNRLPFPGYEALLPTLGAGALLVAALDDGSWTGRWLGYKPTQYLGAVSYSLYLWHWPIIVFYPQVTGRAVDTLQDGVLVVVISLICAHLSRELIEERFRQPRRGEIYRPYVLGASMAIGIAAISVLIIREADNRAQQALQAAATTTGHPGALAWTGSKRAKSDGSYIPDADVARLDRGPAYGLDGGSRCIGSITSTDLIFCSYGPAKARRRVVIVGDSHAVHWLPALEIIAAENNLRITGLTKSSCAFTDEMVRLSLHGSSRPYIECRTWGAKALKWLLKDKPDLVIISHSPRHLPLKGSKRDGQDAIAQGVRRYAMALQSAGIKVAGIQQSPWQQIDVPDCMASKGASVETCSTSEVRAFSFDSITRAASLGPEISLIKTRSWFCRDRVCPVVIGGVLVYRDRHHLTATYARSLSPLLSTKILALLKGSGK